MTDGNWWTDDEAAPTDQVGNNSPRVPEHWFADADEAAATTAMGRPPVIGTAPETVSSALPQPPVDEIVPPPLADHADSESKAPTRSRGRIVAIASGGVILAIALFVAISGGSTDATRGVDPASVNVPSGFEQDAAVDRARAGLSDAFSEPLAYRNGEDLLLIYSREVAPGDVEDERLQVGREGDFAEELTAGLPGYDVVRDEAVTLGEGGRLVELATDGAELVAVRFLLRSDEHSSVIVVAAGGSPPPDVLAIAAGLRIDDS